MKIFSPDESFDVLCFMIDMVMENGISLADNHPVYPGVAPGEGDLLLLDVIHRHPHTGLLYWISTVCGSFKKGLRLFMERIFKIFKESLI